VVLPDRRGDVDDDLIDLLQAHDEDKAGAAVTKKLRKPRIPIDIIGIIGYIRSMLRKREQSKIKITKKRGIYHEQEDKSREKF
jgi:hypothetical protein